LIDLVLDIFHLEFYYLFYIFPSTTLPELDT
jgi:hypothetical protein